MYFFKYILHLLKLIKWRITDYQVSDIIDGEFYLSTGAEQKCLESMISNIESTRND